MFDGHGIQARAQLRIGTDTTRNHQTIESTGLKCFEGFVGQHVHGRLHKSVGDVGFVLFGQGCNRLQFFGLGLYRCF